MRRDNIKDIEYIAKKVLKHELVSYDEKMRVLEFITREKWRRLGGIYSIYADWAIFLTPYQTGWFYIFIVSAYVLFFYIYNVQETGSYIPFQGVNLTIPEWNMCLIPMYSYPLILACLDGWF